jgi:hypothetical protein
LPRKRKTTHIRGRGGARPGAGRPKGRINKVSREERAKYAESGELPLDYMMRIMRDARYPKARRDQMAMAAAPYFHAKLSSMEIKNKKGEKFRLATADMSAKEAMEAYMSTLSQPTFEDGDETKH